MFLWDSVVVTDALSHHASGQRCCWLCADVEAQCMIFRKNLFCFLFFVGLLELLALLAMLQPSTNHTLLATRLL